MKRFLTAAVFALASTFAVQGAQAATSTLDFTGPSHGICHMVPSCSLSLTGGDLAGTNVSFSNAFFEAGGPRDLWHDPSGFVVGSGGLPNRFDIVFDTTALLTGVTGINSGGLGFSVWGGAFSPTPISAGLTGSFAVTGLNILFEAGTVYTLQSHQNCATTSCGLTWIETMTFGAETPAVPLPASGLLLLTGLVGVALRRRR